MGSSMIRIRNAKDLTKTILALQAIKWGQAFVPLIRMQSRTEERAALYGALCVYYARAFTDNSGFGMLSSKAVSAATKPLHDTLLRHRHESAAHSDAAHEFRGILINRAYLRSDGAKLSLEDRHLSPGPSLLAEIESHLATLATTLHDAVGEYMRTGPPSHTRYPKGLYLVDVNCSQGWNLIPVEDDGLDE